MTTQDSRPTLLAVCTIAPWPVLDGYSLRVAHLLQGLTDRWSIVLVAPPSPETPPGIEPVPVNPGGPGITYPWRFDQTALRAAVDRTVRGRHFDRALVWPGAESLWFGRNDLPPAVVDIIDCNPLEFWRGFLNYRGLRQRYRALSEIAVATRFAHRTARSFTATVCVGEADARWQRRIGGAGVHVVPNGVEIPADDLPPEADIPTLAFTGSLDYQPNIEAVLYAVSAIWPLVAAGVPRARFVIAGRNPTPEIRALNRRQGVDVIADVPDMNRVLGRSWVSIAPMRSGVGIKNKVLEAWACARPVVLTKLASNGLIVPPDHAPLVQEGAAALAAAVIRLFNDPGLRLRLGRSARANVERNFTWAGAADQLDALLRQGAPIALRAVSAPESRR